MSKSAIIAAIAIIATTTFGLGNNAEIKMADAPEQLSLHMADSDDSTVAYYDDMVAHYDDMVAVYDDMVA